METLDALNAKYIDTDVGAISLSKWMLASSSYLALIATFVRRKQTSQEKIKSMA